MSSGSQNAPQIDNREAGIIVFVALLVVGWFWWNYRFGDIAFVWKAIRYFEFWLADKLVPDAVEERLSLAFHNIYEWLKANPSRTYTPKLLAQFEGELIWFVRIPVAILLLLLAYRTWTINRIGVKQLTPEDCVRLMATRVPGNEFLLDFDPSKIPLEYDFAKSPNENAFRMPVTLIPFITARPPIGFLPNEIDRAICEGKKFSDYDEKLAAEVFRRQMGPHMPKQLSKLPEAHRKAIDIMLERIPAEHRDAALKKCFATHAYVRTFLMGLLHEAHQFGVLPPIRFRGFLHPADRVGYLALFGARSGQAFLECLGVVAHYLVEQKIGRAIPVPQIEPAVAELSVRIKALQSGELVENGI
ncbi:MAG: hypothetical protein D6712_21170 [Chloroflexi bacterium]|nr:MAG: hypothetical protein D6712_21170 [Chloroflexota bacterium]